MILPTKKGWLSKLGIMAPLRCLGEVPCAFRFRAIFRGEMLVFWEGNTAPEMCMFFFGEKMMMMMMMMIIIIIIIIMIYPGLVN